MKNLAIIPARSGSKGLKDKNIIEVNGLPLFGYTINAAKKSGCFDTVMVSTDSQRYAELAKRCGADVPFLRTNNNSSDVAGSWDVVREVLTKYKGLGKEYDYVVLLQPTSPLRDENDIRAAFELLNGEEVNNVVSVTNVAHPVQWCFKLNDTLSMDEYANSKYASMRRQDLDLYYQENGAIYIVKADNIMNKEYNLYKDKCKAFIMEREKSVDIDSAADLVVFEAMINFLHKKC